MSIHDVATANFERHLKQNAYPGRGLVVGRSSIDDAWLMIYWIMGRSASSRNRRFVAEAERLRTEPLDPSLVEDPSLIIYDAMLELPGIYLVGNGDQVGTIREFLRSGAGFDDALATREREPDAPNYTPRISAMLDLRQPTAALSLSILKASPADPVDTDRATYRPAVPPAGLGIGLTTYTGDGNPLPSFEGEPLWLPCVGSVETLLDTYWRGLDADNRLAVAVKRIDPAGGSGTIVVRNR